MSEPVSVSPQMCPSCKMWTLSQSAGLNGAVLRCGPEGLLFSRGPGGVLRALPVVV